MNKEIAKRLIESITPHVMEDLEEYADSEIEKCRNRLEFAVLIEDVRLLQGQISALKSIKKLRENAQNVLLMDKKMMEQPLKIGK